MAGSLRCSGNRMGLGAAFLAFRTADILKPFRSRLWTARSRVAWALWPMTLLPLRMQSPVSFCCTLSQ